MGFGVVSAALRLSLIGGGTYAYFSDQVVTNNSFVAGTLDLAMQPTTSLNLENLKPGKMDWFWIKFIFEDNGTDQNVFQGDSIALKMEFQANQTDGQER
ncbi:TasA family protein [Bacillus toyonensis]